MHVDGETVSTGIYKDPVTGPVHVARLNLDGDRQADLNVHGGVNKAVYGYPIEHYEFWRERYPDFAWQWGAFGENLTVEGLREETLHIGDQVGYRFRVARRLRNHELRVLSSASSLGQIEF